ncbi:MAG: hypothetical protein DMD86_00265, partial [Candidatus Rokuibacteriota bacterium]
QSIEYLEEGRRPSRARGFTWQPGTSALRWVLGGLGAAFVGGLGFLALGSDALGAVGTVFEHVLNIARGARDLVAR